MKHPDHGKPGDGQPSPGHAEEPPPLFGTWRRFYAVVAGALVFWIAVFYWFGRIFI